MHEKITEKRLNIARAFNSKPKEGIALLKQICQDNGVGDPEKQIAAFFVAEKQNLNMDLVGDYLSGPEKENQEVLEHFVGNMDFRGKSCTEALRSYLKSYKLPGEGQKIERLLEAFSVVYAEQNHKTIANQDAAWLLATQTIMLNTELHNPAIKRPMTFEGLKANLKGMNNGQNFDEVLLKQLYEEIRTKPFELNFVPTPPGIEMEPRLLNGDSTLKRLSSFMESPRKSDIGNVFHALNGKDITVTLDHPKPFLNLFTGYKGTATVRDSKTGAEASIQVYQPSIYSRIFFGKKPSVIVQPGANPVDTKNTELAAQLAAGFSTPVKTFKATYDYELSDLTKAFDAAKEQNVKREAKDIGSAISDTKPHTITKAWKNVTPERYKF